MSGSFGFTETLLILLILLILVILFSFGLPRWVIRKTVEFSEFSSGYSNAQPISHLVLLSVLTLNFYQVYWFYRNWKQLKNHHNLGISPNLRTTGIFILYSELYLSAPFAETGSGSAFLILILGLLIVGLTLVYQQFRDIRDYAKKSPSGKFTSPVLLTAVYFMLNRLPMIPSLLILGLLSVWPLAIVQGILNGYWEEEQPKLMKKTELSKGELAVLAIGGIMCIAIIMTLNTDTD